jgi:hypothetical protein
LLLVRVILVPTGVFVVTVSAGGGFLLVGD